MKEHKSKAYFTEKSKKYKDEKLQDAYLDGANEMLIEFANQGQSLPIQNVSNFVCFCGEKAKYRYVFKELEKEIHRCEEHKANDC